MLALAANGAGALVTGVAWVFLVTAAIDFGGAALRGRSLAWVFSLGASLGAVLCLVLLLSLVGRGMMTLGYLSDYQPRRAAARRRRQPQPRPTPPSHTRASRTRPSRTRPTRSRPRGTGG